MKREYHPRQEKTREIGGENRGKGREEGRSRGRKAITEWFSPLLPSIPPLQCIREWRGTEVNKRRKDCRENRGEKNEKRVRNIKTQVGISETANLS